MNHFERMWTCMSPLHEQCTVAALILLALFDIAVLVSFWRSPCPKEDAVGAVIVSQFFLLLVASSLPALTEDAGGVLSMLWQTIVAMATTVLRVLGVG